MAWTTPRTWTLGEVVTGAMLDTDVKANLDYLQASPNYDEIVRYAGSLYGPMIQTWQYGVGDNILRFFRDGANDYTASLYQEGSAQEIKHSANVGSVQDHEHNLVNETYYGTWSCGVIATDDGNWTDSGYTEFANFGGAGRCLFVAMLNVYHDVNDTGLQVRIADYSENYFGPITYIDDYVPTGGYVWKSAMAHWVVEETIGAAPPFYRVKLQMKKDGNSPAGDSRVYAGVLPGTYLASKLMPIMMEGAIP